ncbi:MAG: hypothetical protein U1D55_01400 [Phycisphaerae bacterium]
MTANCADIVRKATAQEQWHTANRARQVGLTMYETAYTYDTDYANPLTLPYPTRNNRLLSYAEQTDGVPTEHRAIHPAGSAWH